MNDISIDELIKIRGIGQVMARNFLKEIGNTKYGKPDIHLKSIFEIIENKKLDEEQFDLAIEKQAKLAKVTVYKLDRIIWLICSGNYFKDNIKIPNEYGKLRKKFEKNLNEYIIQKNANKILIDHLKAFKELSK